MKFSLLIYLVKKKKRIFFSIHLQKNGQNASSFALDILAQNAVGFNGAEIEECVKEAMFTAYVESQESHIAPKLQMIHLIDAIKNTFNLNTDHALDEIKIPFSDPNIYSTILSTFVSIINKKSIKR